MAETLSQPQQQQENPDHDPLGIVKLLEELSGAADIKFLLDKINGSESAKPETVRSIGNVAVAQGQRFSKLN